MGGSGGGGGYPPGGAGSGGGTGGGGVPGDGGDQDCVFDFTTTIFGPVPGVADQLRKGSVLEVRLTGGRSVGLFDPQQSGQQVGTVAGATQIPALVACLADGNEYVATVTSVQGSQIVIQVSNA